MFTFVNIMANEIKMETAILSCRLSDDSRKAILKGIKKKMKDDQIKTKSKCLEAILLEYFSESK